MTGNAIGGAAGEPHPYVSTACFHGECGACRETCKFCNAPCSHACHPEGRALPEPWVTQARDIARELYEAARKHGHGVLPPVLAVRALDDPALFWLRGETEGKSSSTATRTPASPDAAP